MSSSEAWLPELRAALPYDAVVDDPDVVSGYARDMAMLAPNGGIMNPGKVFSPPSAPAAAPALAAVGR